MIIDDLPDAPDPVLDPPKTFSFKAAAMVLALKKMVAQIRVAIANMNSIAAGGAYAIPFVNGIDAQIGFPAGGKISLAPNSGGQNAATTINLDGLDAAGYAVRAVLDDMYYAGGNANATSKGYVRLVKAGDPTKWLTFRIVSWSYSGTQPYGWLTVVNTGYSSPSPFAMGDAVVAQFQRNGDRGDQGPAGTSNVVLLGSADVGSAVANIDFLNIFTSGYDRYEIEMHGVTASTAANVLLQFATGGSVDSATSYYPMTSGSGGALTGNTPVSSFSFGVISTGATSSMSAVIRVLGSTRVGHNKPVQVEGVANSSVLNLIGMYGGAAALSGFRLSPSAGNFTGGRIRVYGFKNS